MLIINKTIVHPCEAKIGDVDIDVRDIAHALSNICCYYGRTKVFYSYAEHSLRLSQNVPPEDKLWALMSCAWRSFGARTMQKHVEEHLHIGMQRSNKTDGIYRTLLATEQRDLLGVKLNDDAAKDWRIRPLDAGTVVVDFINHYEALKHGLN